MISENKILVNISNVTVSYSSETVIDNVSLEIIKGSYLCFFGENGSGKSTLMKAILGLIPVKSGKIEKQKNLQLGYLPQSTVIQKDFPISVYEVALSGYIKKKGFKPFYPKKMRLNAIENLKKVGMDDYINKSFKELSGGQQQRVLLARALGSSSDILFFDEPVTALDPIATNEFYEIVKKLNEEGMTIVMISHDIHRSLADATHIVHIGNHTAEFVGKKEDYLKSETGKSFINLRR